MKQEKKYNIPNCIVGGGSCDLYKSLWKEENLLFNKISSFLFWSKGGTI